MSAPETIVAAYFQALSADPSVTEGRIGKLLEADGHDAHAALLVSRFGPLVLGRQLLDGLGVSFSDTYIVANPDGSVAEQGELSSNPYYSALEVAAQAHPALVTQVGARSAEFNATNEALHAGAQPADVVSAPIVMFNGRPQPGAMNQMERALELQATRRPWWKFW